MRSSAVVVLLAVACAGSTADAAATKPLPPLATRCGIPAQATPFRFRATDSTLLDGAVLGRGRVGVVFAHEYGADLCNWLSYGLFVSREGFLVLLFDFRGFGLSAKVTGARAGRLDADVAGAVAELRRRGAAKVVIVGASIGGAAVLAAAASARPPEAGVVSISAPDTPFLRQASATFAVLDPTAAATRIRSPVLFLHGKDDPFVPPATSKRLYRTAISTDKRLVLASSSSHATSLLEDPTQGVALRKLILTFIRTHTRP